MARSYANLATAIWRDDEFRLLCGAAQLAYLMLMSQPDISAAGVLSLNLTRWASRTKDVTKVSLRAAIEELEAHRFVVVDDETEELLVRSFVRWDNGYSNPKRSPVIRDAIGQIESTALLRVLADEIDRLGLVDERWKSAFSQLNSLSDGLSDRHADGVLASERVVVTTASTTEPSTLTPQQATPVPSAQADPPASGRRRGTRIPDDFHVTPEMVAWAGERVPDVNGRHETEKFINHWRSKSGRDATKVNWELAWRNWMLRASERPNGRAKPTTDQKVAQALAVGAQLQAEADRKAIGA